jgi:hypothetical protein
MNILYIHQYFKTPAEPEGIRSYWFALALVKEGYNVTILTTSSNIKNHVEKTIIDGINVISLKVAYCQDMSIFKRLFSFSILNTNLVQFYNNSEELNYHLSNFNAFKFNSPSWKNSSWNLFKKKFKESVID